MTREPSGSALGRLLATCTTRVSSASKAKGNRGPGKKTEVDACPVQEIVNELRAGSTQKHSVPLKSSSVEERAKTVYVLGERPASNKAVPRTTKDGRCVKTLNRDRLCLKSRRRVQPVEAYNHFKEYCEEEDRYNLGRKDQDRGDEVMPANTTLTWEGRGFVSWG